MFTDAADRPGTRRATQGNLCNHNIAIEARQTSRYALAALRADVAEVSSGTHRRDANMKGDETTIKTRDRTEAGNRSTRVPRCGKSHNIPRHITILFYQDCYRARHERAIYRTYTCTVVLLSTYRTIACVATADVASGDRVPSNNRSAAGSC